MPQRTTVRATKVPEIRRGDTVVVLVGRDAGKRGVVERVVRRAPAASGAFSAATDASASAAAVVISSFTVGSCSVISVSVGQCRIRIGSSPA